MKRYASPAVRSTTYRIADSIDALPARVVTYIEENLGEDLTLGALAGVACISRFHFARMFRLSTGSSPMAYVVRRRIEQARLQLVQGYQKISDLAAHLGFCDQSHFTRIFRRRTGLTPREYSRRHFN